MIAKILISTSLEKRIEEIEKILSVNNFKNPHPDLIYFGDQEKLGVGETKKIREFLSLRPYQAKGRAVVLITADNLTPPAQNSLLKTLEEPPEEALILLGVNSENSLLPTILSRCQTVILNDSEGSLANASSNGLRDSSASYRNDIERLEKSTIEQRFSFIEKLEEKEQFLAALINFYREKLHKDPSLVKFSKQLIQTEEWSSSNVNIRAILEYLMLNIPT